MIPNLIVVAYIGGGFPWRGMFSGQSKPTRVELPHSILVSWTLNLNFQNEIYVNIIDI